ncbi:Transcription factor CP2 [Taenia solium]|eukprot:TsM_000695400 transcript=TsM_000695400 gene=TsM_000695400
MDPDPPLNFLVRDPSSEMDSTLLSLNSDISDTMFNMSDALSALPSELQILESENDLQACKRKSKDTSYAHAIRLTIELKASTSPATLLSEDSLTYLNQDQPYTIEISDAYGENPCLIKSVVRICFYQERLQINEARHLAFWQTHHQGERMLDLDVDGCFNFREVYADPDNLNAVVCVWYSSAPCSLSLKAHCVSTEFTAKKHGGEKGVPFRIQVDSFRECDNSHLYSAACQVKVFKPKGADRKNRTDREKIDKRTKFERQQYRSAAPTTFLEEVAYCPISRLALNDPAPSATTEHSALAALEDFLSSGNQHQQTPLPPPSLSTLQRGVAVVDATSISPLCPSLLMQCKRSAQDREGLDAGLLEFNLMGRKATRQATAPVPFPSPPVKNGRLFDQEASGDHFRNSPIAVSEVNVDALPLSRCEISEHHVCTSSFQPNFAFSMPSTTPTGTSTSRDVFKHPQIQSSSSVPSQKRSTTPGDEMPCPGTCSCCGRACSASITSTGLNSEVSLEFSVKRLRRKRQSMMGLRHMRFSCATQVGQRQPVIPCVPFTTSDYSSHTLDDDNETAVGQRRPSTSSETSQPIPSDKPSFTAAPTIVTTTAVAVMSSVGLRTPRASIVASGRRVRASFRADMSRAAVSNWLRASGFGSLRSKFAKFTGADMLRLNRRDLVLLCGTVEGIRLSNAILQKPPRATCTIFVRKDSELVFQAIYLYQQTEAELRIRLTSYLKLAITPQNILVVLKKAPNFDVAVNDEVVAYFEDQSCFSVCVSELNVEEVTISMQKL